jgi:hypothetical protein
MSSWSGIGRDAATPPAPGPCEESCWPAYWARPYLNQAAVSILWMAFRIFDLPSCGPPRQVRRNSLFADSDF